MRPYNNRDTIEEYRMVLYRYAVQYSTVQYLTLHYLIRFCEQSSFHLSDIQLLSIVEDSVPAMAIALTSHHSTRYSN